VIFWRLFFSIAAVPYTAQEVGQYPALFGFEAPDLLQQRSDMVRDLFRVFAEKLRQA